MICVKKSHLLEQAAGEQLWRSVWEIRDTGYADVKIQLQRKWPKNPSGICDEDPLVDCEIGTDIQDVDGVVVPAVFMLTKADAATHQWMHTWTNLPKTDQKTGLDIIYWIDEISVDPLSPATLGEFVEVKDENRSEELGYS